MRAFADVERIVGSRDQRVDAQKETALKEPLQSEKPAWLRSVSIRAMSGAHGFFVDGMGVG
ncbi:MAG: hypothetical protein ABI702_14210 [Burkholderiales bacterium]